VPERFAKILASVLGVVVLAFASYWSVRLAVADHLFREQTPAAVGRATELAPLNAAYLAFRALQIDYAGGDSTPLLERAAALNPSDASLWIRLGLAAETRADLPAAEKYLLHAATVSSQYEPRWTLANFYFRRENSKQFWLWTYAAFEMSYDGSRRPLFDLCERMGSPNPMLTNILRSDRPAARDYLAYRMEKPADGELHETALILAGFHNPDDGPLLVSVVDRFIDTQQLDQAFTLWQEIPTPSRSQFLTNADFSVFPPVGGFDWRLPRVPGCAVYRGGSPGELKLVFDGKQPESQEVMTQLLLAPRHGRLQFESRIGGGANEQTGLEWTVSGVTLLAHAAIPNDTDWTPHSLEFETPADVRFVKLALIYRRPLGSPRFEGTLQIRKLSLRGGE
jgi:hypothetical protein